MAARKSPVIETASTLGRILGFLGVSALCGVLAAGLLVPMAAATGVTASTSIEFFDDLPTELEVGPLSQPSRVLAVDGTQLASIYAENRKPVALDEVSDVMEEAIIAIEDSRFYEHGGVDVQGIARAAVNNLTSGARQGASTLTQQYVNNVLNEAIKTSESEEELLIGDNKDYGDKIREAKLAIAVEKRFTKEEILTGYLNIVFFNSNAFGIEAAAQYFYGIPAAELNLQQSAMLAGMVRGPSLYDPTTNPELAKQRRDVVLSAMLRQGKITQAEHDEASASELALNVSPISNGCVSANMAEYFCDYVEHAFMAFGAPQAPTPEQVENEPETAEQMIAARQQYADDREKLLRRGGLTIETTLDPRLQKVAQAQVEETAPPGNNPDKIGASMVSVEPGTGKILAMAQNTEMVAPEDQWSNAYNFNVDANMGGTGGYQTGSTFKPYTLATWLDAGKAVEETIDASKRVYSREFDWEASCAPEGYGDTGEFGYYDPEDPIDPTSKLDNFDDDYYKEMSVLDGIVQSINTATFASAAELDLCAISDMAAATGVHNGITGEQINTLKISALIGGNSDQVAPLTMAASFATFAAGGEYCEPYAITAITDRAGEKLEVPAQNCEQTVDEEVAEAVTYTLEQVIERGSGYYLNPEVPAALKTGTTDNSTQTWTVGYTQGIATASWVGNPDEGSRPLNDLRFLGDDTTLDYVDGATYAGEAWQGYMTQVADLYEVGEFPNPPQDLIERDRRSTPAPDDDDDDNDEAESAAIIRPEPSSAPESPAATEPDPAQAAPAGDAAPPAEDGTNPGGQGNGQGDSQSNSDQGDADTAPDSSGG